MSYPKGLYGITPDWDDAPLLAAVDFALQGGLRFLQYRHKTASDATRYRQANALAKLCARYDAQLIVNDSPALALAVEAAGVHLGHDDADLTAARQLLGPKRMIGISCYGDWQRAEQAMRQGADYIAFGAVYASRVKPLAAPASLDLLTRSRAQGYPSVAIGGITLDNAHPVVQAGADAIAVITALFEAQDILQTTQAFSRLFVNHVDESNLI